MVRDTQKTLRRLGGQIGAKVRELRRDRRLSQAALAGRLGLSQSRLSEIERGGGSFSAEQFLLILQLFNVAPSHFVGDTSGDPHAALQNALVRLGARHLRESESVLVGDRLAEVNRVVYETLIVATPRLTAALAPVLVRHIDQLNLSELYARLADAGLQRRLAWLVENVRDAIELELRQKPGRVRALHYRRAKFVLETFLEIARTPETATFPDLFDTSIRSAKTRTEVTKASSVSSKRYGIVTRIQPEDFLRALRSADVG